MTEKDLSKIRFMQLLELQAINPSLTNVSLKKRYVPTTGRVASPSPDLRTKNDGVNTGYENFHIAKGLLKLYPGKDFDFAAGKRIACLRCFETFASRTAYRDHIEMDPCTRKCDQKRNAVYLKQKAKARRASGGRPAAAAPPNRFWDDVQQQQTDPETLTVRQTRNRRYPPGSTKTGKRAARHPDVVDVDITTTVVVKTEEIEEDHNKLLFEVKPAGKKRGRPKSRITTVGPRREPDGNIRFWVDLNGAHLLSTEAKPSRKRGRPRKTRTVRPAAEPNANDIKAVIWIIETESTAEKDDRVLEEEKPARKRGRPRRKTVRPDEFKANDVQVVDIMTTVVKTGDDAETVDEKPARKRTRRNNNSANTYFLRNF